MQNLEKIEPRIEKQREEGVEEKAHIFKKFLADQMSLPSSEWDKKFKEYVEEKHKKGQKEILERSPEEEKEIDFKRYLDGLELSEEDLRNKRILDIGCGKEGNFVKKCLDNGITEEIYGLDSAVDPDIIEEKYKNCLFKGNFEEKFPVENLDYVVSVGAVEAPSNKLDKRNPQKILLLALEAIKGDGEIRIYPIHKAPPRSDLKEMDFSRKKWMRTLEELSSKEGINYELRPIDIRVAGKKPDVWLEEALVIKKRKERKSL